MAKTMPSGPGTFCWNELMTSNVVSCKDFYSKLLGWTTSEMDMGPAGTYTLFHASGQPVAGMMAMDGPEWTGIPPHWMSYVLVEDVDATFRRVRDFGGEPVVEPTDIPNIGRFAVVKDPSGAALAVFRGIED